MFWRYEGTKSLRLPVLGPQLGIAAFVVERVCVARTLKVYLSRTASCAHQNRVWCSTVARNGVKGPLSHKGDTHRVWMREVMDRCGIDPKFTGGSVGQATSSRAIDDGWEPAAVLRLGQWNPLQCGIATITGRDSKCSRVPLLWLAKARLCTLSHRLAEGQAAGQWSNH